MIIKTSGFCIVDRKGIMLPNTTRMLKKDSITGFITDYSQWPEWYKNGWRCKKVSIQLTHRIT